MNSRRDYAVFSLIFVILVATICLPINVAKAQVQGCSVTKLTDEPLYKETLFIIITDEQVYHILVRANISSIGEETQIYLNATLLNPHNASVTALAYIPDTLTDAPYYSGSVEAFLLHLEEWVVIALKTSLPVVVIVALILQIYSILEQWIGEFWLTCLKNILYGGPLIYASLPWVLLTLLRDTNPDGSFDLYVPWWPPSPHINLLLNGHYYVATSLSWWEIKEQKVYAPWPLNWIVLFTYYEAIWVRSRIIQPPPKSPPQASFYWTPTQPVANEAVTFISTSFDPDGFIVSYLWQLGDGVQRMNKSFSYVYQNAGNYSVTLEVIDNDGLTGNITKIISVLSAPEAKLRVIPNRLELDSSAGRSVSATFVAEENLNKTNLLGVTFVASDLMSPDSYIISSENITFDKNGISITRGTYVNVTMTINIPANTPLGWYSGNVTASSKNGGNATVFIQLYLFGPPKANFTWSPLIPKKGEAITFDASLSIPSRQPITKYEWNFGDGEKAYGEMVTHTYSISGVYNVTLNVTDSEGLWDVEQKQIQVVQPHSPRAEFTVTPETTKVGELVKFDASSSLSGWNGTHNMPITEYRWDFGDGNKTTTTTPTVYHSFSSSGNYYVTLTVYAPGAEPETDSITHKVTAISIPVGGYSISIKVQTHTEAEPIISYTAITALLAATLTKIRTKIKKNIKKMPWSLHFFC